MSTPDTYAVPLSLDLDLLSRIAGITAQIEALTHACATPSGCTIEVMADGVTECITPDQAAGKTFDLIEEREQLLADYGQQWRDADERRARRTVHAIRVLQAGMLRRREGAAR